MAEAFLNGIAGDRFETESAGIEPGSLNPIVVRAMADIGIDISGKTAKSVFDVMEKGKVFDYVITVCDQYAADRCPVFPGAKKKIAWSFSDPAVLTGSAEEILFKVRVIRDQIKNAVERWVREVS
jgi:arsenate reductase